MQDLSIATHETLTEISGCKLVSKQIKWLRENHIMFLLDKKGHPKVAIKHLEKVLGVADDEVKIKKEEVTPNLAALEKYNEQQLRKRNG